MTKLSLPFRYVRARPLRSLLTILAIGFSAGLLGFLLTLNEGLKQDWSEMQGQRAMVTAKTSFFDQLPMAYLASIEAIPGVRRVAPFDFVLAFYKDSRPENQVPVSASPADAFLEVYVEAKVPKEDVAEWLKDPTGSIVGPILVEKFGWKRGDRVVLKAPVQGGVVETTIRGVLAYKLDNGLYIHRKYYEGLTGEQGKAAMFWILANTRKDVPLVTAAIEKKLENAPVPIRAMSEKQWQTQFMEMLGNVQALLGGIGLATAFTLFLITGNTLAMAARERRGQAALLRILGFQRGEVASMLITEAGLYGLCGAVLGMGLMFLFSKFVAAAVDKTQMAGLGGLLVPGPTQLLFVLIFSAVLSFGGAVVPALGLSRRSIVQLLREN
jgi:putative ABC transport system permease protein